MAHALRVSVEQHHIDDSAQRDSRRCMIASALKEQHPHFQKIIVDLATIRWTNPRTKRRYVCLTPERAALALVEFDQGRKVDPFSFGMNYVQVTPTRAATEDAGADQLVIAGTERPKRVRRGRKRLRGDGVIVGGEPVPTGHLSNVQVSRNDYRVFGRRLLRGG